MTDWMDREGKASSQKENSAFEGSVHSLCVGKSLEKYPCQFLIVKSNFWPEAIHVWIYHLLLTPGGERGRDGLRCWVQCDTARDYLLSPLGVESMISSVDFITTSSKDKNRAWTIKQPLHPQAQAARGTTSSGPGGKACNTRTFPF